METFRMMNVGFGKLIMDQAQIFEWFSKFKAM
jgi:hypothetical protein